MRPCGFPPSITHGYVVSGQTNLNANYQCKVQHEISKSTIQCTSGTWEAVPTCTGKLHVVTLSFGGKICMIFHDRLWANKVSRFVSIWWKFTGFYKQILLYKHKDGLTINIETNIAHQHFLFSVWMGTTFEGDRVSAAKLWCSLRHFHCVRIHSTSPDWRPQIIANSIGFFFKSLFKLTKKKTSKLRLVPLTKPCKTFHGMISSVLIFSQTVSSTDAVYKSDGGRQPQWYSGTFFLFTRLWTYLRATGFSLSSHSDMGPSTTLMPRYSLPHNLKTSVNPLAPGDVKIIQKCKFSNSLYKIEAWALDVKLIPCQCQRASSGDSSTLVQVMAWCRQVPSHVPSGTKPIHYLSQCWHRSMSPYGITRSQ